MDGYLTDKFYFDNAQVTVLKKVLGYVEGGKHCKLSDDELSLFRNLISEHTLQ